MDAAHAAAGKIHLVSLRRSFPQVPYPSTFKESVQEQEGTRLAPHKQ